MRKLLPAIIVVVLAIGAFWYFSHRGDRSGLLAHVPADTPWVLASTQPLPEHALAGIERQMRAISPLYPAMLQDMRDGLAAEGGDAQVLAVLEALQVELGEGDLEALYERVGMDLAPQLVFYGHGLVPVLRVVLADPDRFEAFIVRLEAAGGALEVLPVGGHTARRVPLGEVPVDLLMAIIDDQLVATVAPKDAPAPLLEELMGLRMPGQSLANTRALRRLNRDYGFQPNYSGYLDMRRLAEHIMAPATMIESAFMSALDIEKPVPTPQCRAEFQSLAEAWPRAVAGYTRLDATVQEARLVLEAREDISESLMGLRAPMPGPDARSEDSLLDIGLALRLDALPGVVNRFADEARADPWQCESLLALNEGFAQLRQQMSNPGLFMAAPLLQSLYVSVDEFAPAEAEAGIPVMAGVLAFGSQNPASLVSMAQAFLPQLATIGLEPDRQPRSLPLDALGIQAPAEVAMSENALAVAIGADALPRLSQGLGSSRDAGQPILHVAMGSRLYALLNDAFQEQMASLEGIDPAMLEGLDEDARREFEALRTTRERLQREAQANAEIYAGLFKRLQFELGASEHGVEFRQRIEMH